MAWLTKVMISLTLLLLWARKGNGATFEQTENCRILECPSYQVLHQEKHFEIRSYKSATWMSTSPINSSSYKEAANIGFNSLFAYIQGKNQKGVKIEMTAPVLVDIAPSTGPFCNSSFVVHFYVPQKFQPVPPASNQVHAESWPRHSYAAVRRFGGFMDDTNIVHEALALKQSLMGTPWQSVAVSSKGKSPSTYTVAGYNSPYEYENRVNEVMFLFDDY